MSKPKNQKPRWLDQPKNIRLLLGLLIAFGVLLVIADAFYNKHIHFAMESLFGAYAIFGFVAFIVIVIAGKYLRKILMRPEDYYDD